MSTENNPSTPAYCQVRKVLRYLILVVLATSGCMRTSVVALGPENYPAVVADSVRVFLSVDEIPGEYVQIALIDAYEEGECTGSLCISRDGFLKELKKKAGELGANGIVLDVEALPGVAEMGRGDVAGLRALAIRMLTTETVSTDVVMLTPHRYAPIATDSVSVFLHAWYAPREYEQIALIDAYEIAKCSLGGCPRQSAMIGELKKQAGAIGANGIIIEGVLAEIREVRRGETAVRVIAIRFQSPEPH